MNYLVINTDKYNFKPFPNGIFYAVPILSGEYKGKFAGFSNYNELFPEVYDVEPYEEVSLDQTAFKVDSTPPPLSIYAVEIPETYQWVFSDNKFVLDANFFVPLNTYNNLKIVNVAYFEWQEFRDQLDIKDENGNFIYAALKRSLMPLWDYVGLQIQNGNVIEI